MAIAVIYKTGTIAAGQSLSSAIDCTTGAPTILYIPYQWTPARLSYLVSFDGTSFFDLYDRNAHEIAVNCVPGSAVRLNPEWTDSALGGWLKIRSGTRDLPVVQEGARTFTMMIDVSV